MTPNEYKQAWRAGVLSACSDRLIEPALLMEDHAEEVKRIRLDAGLSDALTVFDSIYTRTCELIDASY